MPEPCDRKRCGGQLEPWAQELRPDGTTWSWLVCDRDARHTVTRDTAPAAAGDQTALPGMEDTA